MYMECRHILPGGDKCCAAAVRTKAYCYFHLLNRRIPPPPLNAGRKSPRNSKVAGIRSQIHDQGQAPDLGCIPAPDQTPAQIPHSVPLLEDRMAVQIALTNVLEAIAANRIDAQRAGLLLYGLQIASSNARDLFRPMSASIRSYTVAEGGEVLGPIEKSLDMQDYKQPSSESD